MNLEGSRHDGGGHWSCGCEKRSHEQINEMHVRGRNCSFVDSLVMSGREAEELKASSEVKSEPRIDIWKAALFGLVFNAIGIEAMAWERTWIEKKSSVLITRRGEKRLEHEAEVGMGGGSGGGGLHLLSFLLLCENVLHLLSVSLGPGVTESKFMLLAT